MKYTIKGEGVEISESFDVFVQQRLDSLNKYFVIDEATDALVKVSQGKGGAKKLEVVKIKTQQEVAPDEINDKEINLEKIDDEEGYEAEDELVIRKGGEDLVFKVEVSIPTKFGVLRAESTEKDVYEAVDRVVDKLERQIRKQKTKFNKARRSKEKVGLALAPEFMADIDSDSGEFDEDEDQIYRVKEITPEAKDVETAILEMEMLGHDFYIYRDMDTEQIHVIYKRKAGGYGIIETKTEV
jgi:putative sigma-54 modulation protein